MLEQPRVNRLLPIISNLISDEQVAFLEGGNIIAQELGLEGRFS